MNPGMILRLEQRTLDKFKKAMETFLPHYINFDAHLPEQFEYHFHLLFEFLTWDVKWTNITYEKADLDIADT